jgi:hypothetical protein
MHACMRISSPCCPAQYLVTDNDAPRVASTVPPIIYHWDPASMGDKGLSQSGSLEVKGQQGLAQILPQVNLLFSKATDALFGNSTAMAAVEVRKFAACKLLRAYTQARDGWVIPPALAAAGIHKLRMGLYLSFCTETATKACMDGRHSSPTSCWRPPCSPPCLSWRPG